jgi:hypothetical protein
MTRMLIGAGLWIGCIMFTLVIVNQLRNPPR